VSGTVFGAAGVADGIFNPNCATAFDTQGSEPYRKPGDRHLVKLVFARAAAGTAAVGKVNVLCLGSTTAPRGHPPPLENQ